MKERILGGNTDVCFPPMAVYIFNYEMRHVWVLDQLRGRGLCVNRIGIYLISLNFKLNINLLSIIFRFAAPADVYVAQYICSIESLARRKCTSATDARSWQCSLSHGSHNASYCSETLQSQWMNWMECNEVELSWVHYDRIVVIAAMAEHLCMLCIFSSLEVTGKFIVRIDEQ